MKTVPDNIRYRLDHLILPAKEDYYKAVAEVAVLVAMGEDMDYSWIGEDEMQMFTDIIEDVRDHLGGRT